MLDMEDGPEQRSLSTLDVQRQVLRLLPGIHFDMLLTHGPQGEYTWHRRHAEDCQAVVALWRAGRISGATLGRSGATGLAGGDHLHFTMLLHGLPVDPREWWDGHWIEDRVQLKLGPGMSFQP